MPPVAWVILPLAVAASSALPLELPPWQETCGSDAARAATVRSHALLQMRTGDGHTSTGIRHPVAAAHAEAFTATAAAPPQLQKRLSLPTSTGHAGPTASIKVAKEEIESMQTGLVAFNIRSMKEMNDMQKLVMNLVAWLLFGNVLLVLAMCLWQIASPKHTASAAADAGDSCSQERPTLKGRLLKPAATSGTKMSAEKALAMLSFADLTSLRPYDGLLMASSASRRRAQDQHSFGDPILASAALRASSATGSMGGGSGTRGSSCRTVDALCTPGRTRDHLSVYSNMAGALVEASGS